MNQISGEIYPKSKQDRLQAEVLPSVIIEAETEHERVADAVSTEAADILSQETEDSLLVMLEAVDDELKRVKTRLRSVQETVVKYATNDEIVIKLNEESKFFQRQFDELVAKKDEILGKIKQLKKLNQAS